jgi:hypothetical protein
VAPVAMVRLAGLGRLQEQVPPVVDRQVVVMG